MLSRIALLVLLLSPSQFVHATFFAQMTDSDMLDQSQLVVSGVVVDVVYSDNDGRIETHYQIHVKETLKGGHQPEITVAVPGGMDSHGNGLKLFGAPDFSFDEEVLLFLNPRTQSTYTITQFLFGAFHIVKQNGNAFAIRDFSEAIEVSPHNKNTLKQGDKLSGIRDVFLFKQWIMAKSADLDAAASYVIPGTDDSTANDGLTTGQYSVYGARWQEFDTPQTVSWAAHVSGQLEMVGGGFTEFQQALSTWTDDTGSDISYTYSGTTSANAGMGMMDNINSILFDDPNHEIDGSFSCNSGGTLAVGGYYSSGSHIYKGQSFGTIVEGNVVTQDGAGCYFSGNNGANGAEVFAHELGHTLGLRHSADTNALMYAIAHGDNRGAALSSDDQAAVAYLYEAVSTPLPTVPGNLSASNGTHADRVAISWSSSVNADSYQLYRSTTTTSTGSQVYNGSNRLYNDFSAQAGTTYYYRVRACNTSGCSNFSAQDSGFRPQPTVNPPQTPTGLSAGDGVHTDRIEVSWNVSSNTDSYQLYRSTNSTTTGLQIYNGTTTHYNDSTALQDTTYYYRVRACNSDGCSNFSAQDSGFRLQPTVNPPQTPTGISAGDGVHADRVEVSWNVSANTDSYQLYRSTNSTTTGSQVYNGTTTHYNDSTALQGTTYYYRVRACNSDGCSTFSIQDSGFRLQPTAESPQPPSGVLAGDGTHADRVVVNWNVSARADSYRLYRSTTSTTTGSHINDSIATQYNDLSAQPGITYYYSVTACNEQGCSAPSSQDSGFRLEQTPQPIPVPPHKPTSLTASDGTHNDQVTLSWNAVVDALFYRLYRSTTAQIPGVEIYSASATRYNDYDVEPGVTYYYSLQACNNQGCSERIMDPGSSRPAGPQPQGGEPCAAIPAIMLMLDK